METRQSALAALTATESAGVLSALLCAHPSLAAEAERLAAELLGRDEREAVAADVADELRALDLGDLSKSCWTAVERRVRRSARGR